MPFDNYKLSIRFLGTVLVCAVIFCVVFQMTFGHSWIWTSAHAFGSDDAYITYRYSYNLFNGDGACYNCGEYVEGYSNFLYMLFIVPGFLITSDYIYFYSVFLNLLLLLCTLYCFYSLCGRLVLPSSHCHHSGVPDVMYGFIATAIIGLSSAVWANVTTGLETMLVLNIFVLFWYVIEDIFVRDVKVPPCFYLIAAVSMVSRVDGFILPVIGTLFLLLNRRYRSASQLLGFTVVFMGVYTACRYGYYNDFIANTYYAKVSGPLYDRIIAGMSFLFKACRHNGILPGMIVCSLYCVRLLLRLMRSDDTAVKRVHIPFDLVFFLCWCSYMVYIGGDVYYERFMLPVFVTGVFRVFYFAVNNDNASKSSASHDAINPGWGLIALVVFYLTCLPVLKYDGRFRYHRKSYDMHVSLGLFLRHAPEYFVIATGAAGKVPYFSRLETIDMLGLNNRHIGKKKMENTKFVAGHCKYDAEYVFSIKPHLIIEWIDRELNMQWGITRNRYRENYRLKYLVSAARADRSPSNILDVENMAEVQIQKLIATEGYSYGVIVRKDSLASLPHIKEIHLPLFELFSKVRN